MAGRSHGPVDAGIRSEPGLIGQRRTMGEKGLPAENYQYLSSTREMKKENDMPGNKGARANGSTSTPQKITGK